MIAARMTSRGVRLNVLGDAVGWHAVVYGGGPCHATKAQAEVDQIVQRLRANYDRSTAGAAGLGSGGAVSQRTSAMLWRLLMRP